MSTNNFEFTITIKNLEATTNGCQCEDIQLSSKGEYGNEYLAVLGSLVEKLVTKIPDPEPVKETVKAVKTIGVKAKESLPAGTFDDSEFTEVKPACLSLTSLYDKFEKEIEAHGFGGYLYENNGYGTISIKRKKVSTKKGDESIIVEEPFSIQLEIDKITIKGEDDKGTRILIFIYDRSIYVKGIAPQFMKKFMTDNGIPSWVNEWANTACEGRKLCS